MKVVAFVPIRLNSKRVSGKNVKMLGDKPLLRYILDTLIKVKNIDEVYVYSSSKDILQYLPENVKWLKRPESLDQDITLGEEIYDAFVKEIDSDVYILAHATSPFIKADTIENAIEKVTLKEYDSAFTVKKIQTFAWFKDKPLNYDLCHIPRTQTIEPVYVETSAFYIFKKDIWINHHQRIGFQPYKVIVDKIEGVDIDWPEDFEFAEKILQQNNICKSIK